MPQANIKKRPDGLYKRKIAVGKGADGKTIYKYLYAKTIRELNAEVAEYRRNMKYGFLAAHENATFGEVAETLLRDFKPNLGERTRQRYEGVINTHLAEISFIKCKNLKTAHLYGILNRLAMQGYSSKTMHEIKQVACQVLKLALHNDIVIRNVFEGVKIQATEPNERRALTEAEIGLIWAHYEGHRIGVPALLMLYTGIRRGELIALTWNDIDFQNKTLTVSKSAYFTNNQPKEKPPKTKAGTRSIPIPDIAIGPLLEAKRKATSFFVCPSAKGTQMSDIACRRAWDSFLHHLNIMEGGRDASRSNPGVQVIDRFTPHMLRHTYATMLYDSGVDLKSAQTFMGHSDIKLTLKVYTHLSQQKKAEATAAINAHLANKNTPVISEGVKRG